MSLANRPPKTETARARAGVDRWTQDTPIWVRECRGALFVTLNQPASRNALSAQMVQALAQVALQVQGCSVPLRALVLRGSQGFFCAGGNAQNFQSQQQSADPVQATVKSNRQFGHFLQQWQRLDIPVVAAIEGAAMGGGLGLAACADVVLATRDAKMALSETGLGLIPAQITPFVVARIGQARTRRLGLTGLRVQGDVAVQMGLVDALANDSMALDALIAEQLNGIARCAPMANRTLKSLLNDDALQDHDMWLDKSARAFAQCMQSEGVEGVAAFREKRPPVWQTQWSAQDVRAQLPPACDLSRATAPHASRG